MNELTKIRKDRNKRIVLYELQTKVDDKLFTMEILSAEMKEALSNLIMISSKEAIEEYEEENIKIDR
jgi:hypothetical protein